MRTLDEQPWEFVDKTVSYTKRKGFIQIFSDHESNSYIEEYQRDVMMRFIIYLKKRTKIDFKNRDMAKIYDNFIDSPNPIDYEYPLKP